MENNYIGKTYGNMYCIKKDKTKDKRYYIFKCLLCGNEKSAILSNVKRGATNSCGCLHDKGNNTKHGDNKLRIYKIWKTMRQRCNCKNNKSYKKYGARGITVCDEWNDYVTFRNWSYSNGYKEHLTIDRINNDGNYEPNNCRWSTYKEQANNTRRTRFLTIDGVTKPLSYFAEEYNISSKLVHSRLKNGWSEEDSVKIKVGSIDTKFKKRTEVKYEN